MAGFTAVGCSVAIRQGSKKETERKDLVSGWLAGSWHALAITAFFTEPEGKGLARARRWQGMTNVAAGQKADPERQKPEVMVCRTRNYRRGVWLGQGTEGER